jgi:hypothetical protein
MTKGKETKDPKANPLPQEKESSKQTHPSSSFRCKTEGPRGTATVFRYLSETTP